MAFFFGCSSPRSIAINATFQMSIAKNKTVITAGAVLIVTSTILPKRFMNDMSVSEPRVSVPALTAEETAENAILMPIMLKRPAAPSEAVALQGDGKEYNKGDKIALEFQKSVRELGCAAFDEVSEKTVSREKLDDSFDAQILYNI